MILRSIEAGGLGIMKLRRRGSLPLGVLLVVAAVVALTGAVKGSASTPTEWSSCVKPPDTGTFTLPTSGRAFCVVVTTYDGVLATGGQKVDLTIRNYDQNTLTNPSITLVWNATNFTTFTWSEPKPAGCTPVSGSTNSVKCNLPNVPGLGSGATGDPAIFTSKSVSLYFDAVATPGVTPNVTWDAIGRVNEGPSGPPNTSEQSTPQGHTEFGFAGEENTASSFALAGKKVSLGTLQKGSSSLEFKVPSTLTQPYEASLKAEKATSVCFGAVTCSPLQQQLTSSVPGASGILVWHFTIFDTQAVPAPPPNSVKIIHRYDPANVTANADTNTFTGDFSKIDGAQLGATDYYVRNASSGTTFQLSLDPKGPIFDIPGTGTVTLSLAKIRIIGDDNKNEVDTNCNGSLLTAQNPTLPKIPSINPQKVGNTKNVEVYLCDKENGNVGPW
jgi:hypothetical protein